MTKELLIFGAYGELGKGITKSLSQKDYDKIYLFDFPNKEKNDNDPTTVNIDIKDLSVEENVKRAFKEVKPSKDKLFFLYSTIGGFAGGNYLWETNIDEWEKMFSMNLKSNFLIAKYFSELVEKSAGGSICFTSAYVGVEAEEQKGAYGASKGALIHMVETLAKEGKKIKLSANAVAPYIIDTNPNREWMKDADFESWNKPEEIGDLAHSIFQNFHFFTGNILKLTSRFSIRK